MKDCSILFCCMAVRLIWREKVRRRIRAVWIDNLIGLLGIRIIDKVPNAQIMELCEVTKGGG